MSNKNIAVGAAILVSITTFVTLLTETYMTIQSINPVAVIAAITVAVIGIVWFKKTTRQNSRHQKDAEYDQLSAKQQRK